MLKICWRVLEHHKLYKKITLDFMQFTKYVMINDKMQAKKEILTFF